MAEPWRHGGVFDGVAEAYDTHRSGYPREIVAAALMAAAGAAARSVQPTSPWYAYDAAARSIQPTSPWYAYDAALRKAQHQRRQHVIRRIKPTNPWSAYTAANDLLLPLQLKAKH